MDNSLSIILEDVVFEIYPKEAQTSTKLRNWIQRLGGISIISESQDFGHNFSIPLVDLAWCKIHNISVFHKPKEHKFRDFYSSTFIYESYRKKQRQDLNAYRLGNSSLIRYDANQFLEQKLSWDELLAKSCHVEIKDFEHNTSTDPDADVDKDKQQNEKNMDEDGDGQSEDENQGQTQEEEEDKEEQEEQPEEDAQVIGLIRNQVEIPNTSSSIRTPKVTLCRIEIQNQNNLSQLNNKIRKTGKITTCSRFRRTRLRRKIPTKQLVRKVGVAYSKEDSGKLLQYICNNNLHKATGGNLMWKFIEGRKLLSVPRTNQSLKEHFRRQILPNLKKFSISPEDVQKFEDARKEREKGKRKPIIFIPSCD